MNFAAAAKRPLWWDAVQARPTRPVLERDATVDVVVVGAGLTGLWTAYYLAALDRSLKVAVVEQNHVGFGASGRNGGWCHAEYPLGVSVLARDHGPQAAARQMMALFETVDEVLRVTRVESIDCHAAKGGVLAVARSQLQLERADEHIAEFRAVGLGEEHLRRLNETQARDLLNATDVVGGTWSPHAAAVQPALLTHGLADACERLGVVIYESSPAKSIRNGVVEAPHGSLTGTFVVRATEGFTAQLPGERRTMAPLYSHMIATEPLDEAIWQEIGLEDRPTFGDFRNLIIYGQRTADGRLAFGGRGAPYHFRSSIADSYDANDAVHRELVRVLLELFPQLADTEITHRWGGALGAPRDWRPSVSMDRQARLAWAGGYVGDGVNTANLAGRTLADLILERPSELIDLPWVQHRSPNWEPEPIRWAGINAGLWMARQADASEVRSGRPSRLGALGNWMRGKSR